MKVCSIPNCGKPHLARNLCVAHYQKYRTYGDPLHEYKPIQNKCKVETCDGIVSSRGYCVNHYGYFIRCGNNIICKVDGCNSHVVGKGLCQLHYQRLKLNGDPEKTKRNINPPQKCTIEGCNNKYEANGLCQNHYIKKYNMERRKSVISHYSNGTMECSCCKESQIMFLDIDHIKNNGSEQRKQGILSGSKTIDWIIRNNFPQGFQVLCCNCNAGKHRNGGICPHKMV